MPPPPPPNQLSPAYSLQKRRVPQWEVNSLISFWQYWFAKDEWTSGRGHIKLSPPPPPPKKEEKIHCHRHLHTVFKRGEVLSERLILSSASLACTHSEIGSAVVKGFCKLCCQLYLQKTTQQSKTHILLNGFWWKVNWVNPPSFILFIFLSPLGLFSFCWVSLTPLLGHEQDLYVGTEHWTSLQSSSSSPSSST